MTDKKLMRAFLGPIEEEFDVLLMTSEEALEFVDLDRKSLIETIDKEIDFHKTNEDFINGMEYVKGIIYAYYQGRIDEGY